MPKPEIWMVTICIIIYNSQRPQHRLQAAGLTLEEQKLQTQPWQSQVCFPAAAIILFVEQKLIK